ncbi:MAG: hypothetical protein V7724_01770 [Sediminicola sp.]
MVCPKIRDNRTPIAGHIISLIKVSAFNVIILLDKVMAHVFYL